MPNDLVAPLALAEEPRSAQLPLGTQKPNEVIDIVFWSDSNASPLGPLQHEIYNHMLGFAQLELRRAPPAPAEGPDAIRNVFQLKLTEIAGLCGYGKGRQKGERGSKNLQHFCDSALGLRDRSVVYAGLQTLREDGYLVDEREEGKPKRRSGATAGNEGTGEFFQLVSAVRYDIGRDLFLYELPKMLCARLLEADGTTRLDALVLPFSSRAAAVLWELYLRHRAEGRLPKKSWKVWSRLLRAEGSPHDHIRDFNKMFRRALEQVNEYCTEHELRPHYGKAGRAVDEVWIDIVPKDQQSLPLEVQSAQEEAIRLMVRYGVYESTATMYVRRYGADRCRRNIEYAYKQHIRTSGHNLPGRIVAAINNDYAHTGAKPLPRLAHAKAQPSATAEKPSPAVERRDATTVLSDLVAQVGTGGASATGQSEGVKEWLEGLDSSRVEATLSAFYKEADHAVVQYVKRGADSDDKRVMLLPVQKWLAKRVDNGSGYPA